LLNLGWFCGLKYSFSAVRYSVELAANDGVNQSYSRSEVIAIDTRITPVNYEDHSRFRFDGKSWDTPQDSISAFTTAYEKVREGQLIFGQTLHNIVAAVQSCFLLQTENIAERIFIAELFADLSLLISDHIAFYSEKARYTAGLGPLNHQQTELSNNGYYIDSISKSCLQSLLSLTDPLLQRLRANSKGGRLQRSDLSVNSGRVTRKIVRILNKEFLHSGVLESLDPIANRKMKVIGVAYELSVAGSNWWKPKMASSGLSKTLYAHVDRAVDKPKAIVYLTNVKEKNGPTICYPQAYAELNITGLQDFVGRCLETVGRSIDSPLHGLYQFSGLIMDSEGFRRHFMKLPSSMRFNSHFGWDVEPHSQLEDFLLSKETQVLGPAGTMLVFDGARLLHRGGLIEEGERIVLQVIFGHVNLRTKSQQIVNLIKRTIWKANKTT
jgi:hypothetical protein